MKLLVSNPLGRKTFDVINILRIKFNEEDIIYAGEVSQRKLKIIYGDVNFHILRDEYFNEDLNNISENYKNESIVYIPIEEDITIKFYHFVSKFGKKNFKYKLPSHEFYNLSRNKNDLNLFCEDNSIPCPKYFSKENIYSYNFDFPLILKPKIGSGSKGIKFIKSNDELLINNIDFKNYFIQELLDNPKDIKAGFFICNEGEIISFYSHERIRTFPEKGGVSVFSKSDLNYEIRSSSEDIIKKLNWSGFIMIEYLQDTHTDEYKLIEINPRLWGSILLSEFNNANFISLYISLCLDEQFKTTFVETDKFIRWIFPYDIFYFIKNPNNPFRFFKKNKDTCYINFTYSSFTKSFKFIFFTYFDYNKLKLKLFNA
jgi:glutathione synthase/RimK-type ligase-like ATP-grasp enzyme